MDIHAHRTFLVVSPCLNARGRGAMESQTEKGKISVCAEIRVYGDCYIDAILAAFFRDGASTLSCSARTSQFSIDRVLGRP